MTRLPTLLRKFIALRPSERCTLLAAGLWMPGFWLGLRLLGLPRFWALLQRVPLAERPQVNFSQVQALSRLVNVAAHRTLGPRSCLTRSLLLGWLLRRRGIPATLRIGVRLVGGSLEAHAWVEYEGQPVNERPDVGLQFASFGDLVSLDTFHTR